MRYLAYNFLWAQTTKVSANFSFTLLSVNIYYAFKVYRVHFLQSTWKRELYGRSRLTLADNSVSQKCWTTKK